MPPDPFAALHAARKRIAKRFNYDGDRIAQWAYSLPTQFGIPVTEVPPQKKPSTKNPRKPA
jgi:hypothetical protein